MALSTTHALTFTIDRHPKFQSPEPYPNARGRCFKHGRAGRILPLVGLREGRSCLIGPTTQQCLNGTVWGTRQSRWLSPQSAPTALLFLHSAHLAVDFELDQRARVQSCGGIIVRAKFNRVVLSLLGTDAGPQGRHLASLARIACSSRLMSYSSECLAHSAYIQWLPTALTQHNMGISVVQNCVGASDLLNL